MKKKLVFIPFLLMGFVLRSQQLDYATFMGHVLNQNLEYRMAQIDLSVAESDLKAAAKISDVTLDAEYGNNSDWDIAMGQSLSLGLSKSISLGKRSARMQVASQSHQVAMSSLEDYKQNLRANATSMYIDALMARDMMLVLKQGADYMRSLYHSDSIRAARGDISELDAMQTKLEVNLAIQDYYNAQTTYRNALLALSQEMGDPSLLFSELSGTLMSPNRRYDLSQLVDSAINNRQDLQASLHQTNVAQSELSSIRRERTPDIELSLGANYNTQVRNEEAPAPKFVGYTAGISIPLPVSNLNRGEIRSGQLKVQQAQLYSELLRNQVRVEVQQAYNSYESALAIVREFDTYLMDNARQVLQGRQYAYQRGETSLLEVLNAQHTYNDIQQAYVTALRDSMMAWVELNRVAAIWDIAL